MHDKHEYKARVVGTDLRTDIAVLKVDARSLGPITIGDSDELHVGDYVTNGHRQRDRPRQSGHRRLRRLHSASPRATLKAGPPYNRELPVLRIVRYESSLQQNVSRWAARRCRVGG
jgi:hypothetical protein